MKTKYLEVKIQDWDNNIYTAYLDVFKVVLFGTDSIKLMREDGTIENVDKEEIVSMEAIKVVEIEKQEEMLFTPGGE